MEKDNKKTRRNMLKVAGIAVAGVAASTVISPKKSKAADKGSPRLAMIIDTRRCIGCRACTVACKAEYNIPLGRWSAVVKQIESGTYPNTKRHFIPRLCNHCSGGEKEDVPPCVKECPQAKEGKRAKHNGKRFRTGATYKRPDGAILFDNSLCIACGKCIKACPYGVRYFNPFVKATHPKKEGDFGIGKCTFCTHRIDNGVDPSCVNTCPGRARIFGDLNDPNSEVSKLNKKFKLTAKRENSTILPGEDTAPYVFYIDPDGSVKAYKFDKEKKEEEFRDKLT